MDRAKKFVEQFTKTLDVIWENKPKDMPVMIYVYARDPNVRDKDNPDGAIYTNKLSRTRKYDDWHIKQDIQDFLTDK